MYYSLSNTELLGKIVSVEQANQLMKRFGSLHNIARASYEEMVDAGLSRYDINRVRGVLELSMRYTSKQPDIKRVSNPEDSYKLLAPSMEHLEHEVFKVILLDDKHRVISIPLVSVGHLNASLVHPRECFKAAVRQNASRVVLAHNHPSGNPRPSDDDLRITQRLVDCGNVLGIEVIDHIVIGFNSYHSFLKNGQI